MAEYGGATEVARSGPEGSRVRWLVLGSLVLVMASSGAPGAALGATDAATDDAPYVPLQLYNGTWEVAPQGPEGKAVRFTNHCARTHLFFACEQVIDGKTGALVVFMPTVRLASGAQQYRTQALRPDGSRPGEWNDLVIDQSRWVYTWESEDGGQKTHWRNINLFTGSDRIHFQIESSTDGTTWKTENAGDETRVQ